MIGPQRPQEDVLNLCRLAREEGLLGVGRVGLALADLARRDPPLGRAVVPQTFAEENDVADEKDANNSGKDEYIDVGGVCSGRGEERWAGVVSAMVLSDDQAGRSGLCSQRCPRSCRSCSAAVAGSLDFLRRTSVCIAVVGSIATEIG